MTASLTHADLEEAAAALSASPEYRVLRKFWPRGFNEYDESKPVKMGLYVDCETTGLDAAKDKIIELAVVPFEFDADGTVYGTSLSWSWLEDPGVPIPAAITELTGITDDDVRGKRIQDEIVAELLSGACLVVAHHANFDRQFIENRFPAFTDKPWACSLVEVPWKDFGCNCHKLGHLLLEACGEFFAGHRALDDARVGLHVLATAQHEGRTALSYLLESARQPIVRLSATGAPFDVKDALKARGYRWDAAARVWYTDAKLTDVEAETLWLRDNAGVRSPRSLRLTAKDRYSVRAA